MIVCIFLYVNFFPIASRVTCSCAAPIFVVVVSHISLSLTILFYNSQISLRFVEVRELNSVWSEGVIPVVS